VKVYTDTPWIETETWSNTRLHRRRDSRQLAVKIGTIERKMMVEKGGRADRIQRAMFFGIHGKRCRDTQRLP